MAAGLDRRQQTVLDRALTRARRRRSSPRETKALVLAGLVESNLRHLTGGDRDSTGFLQQRPSQGWGPVGESIERDTDQFLRAARKINRGGFKGSAGQLAQAVQRSAYPARYDQRSRQAEALLGGRFRGASPAAGGGDAAGGAALLAGSSGGGSGLGEASSLVPLLQALQQKPAPAPTAGVPSPAHSARATLPEAFQPVSSVGGPSPKPDTSALLEAIRTVGGDIPRAPRTDTALVDLGGGAAGGGGGGGVAGGAPRIRPGGGYKGTKGVAGSLAQIGFDLGLNADSPGAQKRHNKNPYSGTGSDHDHGNTDAYAYDLGGFGSRPTEKSDRAAFRIMRALGDKTYRMGQPIDTSRGVFTVKTKKGTYRIQVIYRGTGERFGGDHLDHIHVGVKRVG